MTRATLVLAPGWAEQYTVNGLAPQPLTEGSHDGRLVFGFGHIAAGDHLTFFLSLQVNPTNVGRRPQTVWLYDGKRELVCAMASSLLIFKSRLAQKVIEGGPLIIVQDGNPIERNLRTERLTLDDVMEEARGQQIEQLDEVQWAVLEATGEITFIKKS